MNLDKTVHFDFGKNSPKNVHETLVTVYQTLEDKAIIQLTRLSATCYQILLTFHVITTLVLNS